MLNAELCAEQGLQPPSASHLSGSVLEMGPAVMCENSLLCVCLFVSLFYLAAVVTDWLPFFFFLGESFLFLYDWVTKIRQRCQNE